MDLRISAIQTRVFHVGEPLVSFLIEHLQGGGAGSLEGKVLAITSKIVSLAEGRVVPKANQSKEALVRAEADIFLGEIGYGTFLTIKHGHLIPSAGIDESNAEGEFYILYPAKPFETAANIRRELMGAFGLKLFGVVLTDSKTTPLRAGVTGMTLAHSGFKGVRNHIGAPDLFGRPLRMTQVNVADGIAAAAVFCMGEADESTPLALMSGNIEFRDDPVEEARECFVEPARDLYWPFFKGLGA